MKSDLLTFLQTEEERSLNSTLLQEVETAIKSYNCELYGDEEDGRSQVVAADVSETTDYMLTSIMDVFAGTGRVVEFEPTDESEEDMCDDATEAMHYVYRKKAGYRFIHDWAKAGLLEKIAISKSCVERKKQREEGIIDALNLPEDLKAAGIIEAEPVEIDEFGEPTHFKVAQLVDGPINFPDHFVPLEEFRVAPDARDLDSAVYVAHISEKSLSELVEMGFEPEALDGIHGDNPNYTLGLARDDGRGEMPADRMGALRKVWLCEEYVQFDLNNDGLAERLCVHRVGNTILNVEAVDYQPFEFWCPFPMQGRLVGQSLADKTIDTQRVNTVLERNALDSQYAQVAGGTFIHEDSVGDHTIDDLLTIRPNRIVRFKGAIPPIQEQKADISPAAFAAIEFKIRQRESRTGITRLNKGVDEDTLNETASGQKALMARGQQMERYVIRNFAEGVARLFQKKRQLMTKYGQPFTIKVDGEYRQVDPSQWPESMDVNIKVGLGSGTKDERIGYRNLVAQAHMALVGSGSPLVSPENVYNNMTGFCKDAGLPPNDLFTHPDEAPQQEPQPDPEMVKAQIEAQKAQAKQQLDEQAAMHKAQLAEAEGARKAEEAYAKMQLEQFKAHTKAMQDEQRAQFEARLALMELQFEQRLAAQKQKDDAAIKKNRPGGDLSK